MANVHVGGYVLKEYPIIKDLANAIADGVKESEVYVTPGKTTDFELHFPYNRGVFRIKHLSASGKMLSFEIDMVVGKRNMVWQDAYSHFKLDEIGRNMSVFLVKGFPCIDGAAHSYTDDVGNRWVYWNKFARDYKKLEVEDDVLASSSGRPRHVKFGVGVSNRGSNIEGDTPLVNDRIAVHISSSTVLECQSIQTLANVIAAGVNESQVYVVTDNLSDYELHFPWNKCIFRISGLESDDRDSLNFAIDLVAGRDVVWTDEYRGVSFNSFKSYMKKYGEKGFPCLNAVKCSYVDDDGVRRLYWSKFARAQKEIKIKDDILAQSDDTESTSHEQDSDECDSRIGDAKFRLSVWNADVNTHVSKDLKGGGPALELLTRCISCRLDDRSPYVSGDPKRGFDIKFDGKPAGFIIKHLTDNDDSTLSFDLLLYKNESYNVIYMETFHHISLYAFDVKFFGYCREGFPAGDGVVFWREVSQRQTSRGNDAYPAESYREEFTGVEDACAGTVPDDITSIRVVALKYGGKVIAFRFKTNAGSFDMRKSVAIAYGLGGFKTEKYIQLSSVNGMLMSDSERKRGVCVPDVSECKEDCDKLIKALFGT